MAGSLPAIELPAWGVRVAASALRWRAVRASGAGGQNVNKVATKVELRLRLADIEGLGEAGLQRLRRVAAHLLTLGEELVITSERTRDQGRNLADAHSKLCAVLERAATRPRPRRATRPSRGAKARRLADKRHLADKKRQRRGEEGG